VPICPTCGAWLKSGTERCPDDGTPLVPGVEAKPPAAPEAPSPPLPPPAQREPKRTVPAKQIAKPPPTPTDPLVDRILDGRYRVLERLGAGGVGEVYRGEHVEMKKLVAIKVLHGPLAASEEFRKRFEREAQAASKLSHPACVSVIDFGRVVSVEPADAGSPLLGMPYLVMEFVRGKTLAERLEGGPLVPAEAVLIARGLCSALRHAHSHGLVHRDLKPGNVMLDSSAGTGTPVKLLDFGLAKQVADEPQAAQLTAAGMVFGTPSYLSPEQASGLRADARSDLYALGVVLFEMVCGAPPFTSDDPIDNERAHLSRPPPRPREKRPEVSAELEQVILKLLAKSPAERYQTAEEAAAALAACPEGAPDARKEPSPAAPSPPPAAAPAPRRPIPPKWVAAAAGGAVLVAVGCAIALWPRKPPPAIVAPAPPPPPTPSPVFHFSAAGERVEELVRSGRHDEAIAHARAALAKTPRDGSLRFALGEAYEAKLWCSDALEEWDKALRESPELRVEPELTRRAIACLRSRTQGQAVRFLVDRIGPPALPHLQAAAASDPSPDVRRGAERALSEIH
jgi:serine/threonine-protein kinase